MKSKKIALYGVFIALIFVTTYFTKIPLPGGGYFNAGDCFVILAGVVCGPVWGAVCAGIGSALSDAFAGYFVYVPITFAVKAVMGVAVGLLGRKKSILKKFVAVILSEVIMIAGYFVAETVFFGVATAFAGLFGNIMQGTVSIVLGMVLIAIITKNTAIKNALNKF